MEQFVLVRVKVSVAAVKMESSWRGADEVFDSCEEVA
jgi:hypothetical protein